MSIIHDALKKVQQANSNQSASSGYIYDNPPAQESQDVSPQAASKAAETKKNPADTFKSILMVACAALITISSFLFIWKQLKDNVPKVQIFARNAQKSLTKMIPQFSPATTPKVAVEKPLAQVTLGSQGPAGFIHKPVTLNVHGIMANSNGSNVALINDQVYQEGDTVEGAKIIKINLDSITISTNGMERTINVKS